jgi:hypothetical protein
MWVNITLMKSMQIINVVNTTRLGESSYRISTRFMRKYFNAGKDAQGFETKEIYRG